jgi:hypothetical protein
MERLKRYIQWRRFSGTPIVTGDVVVTPESRALIVRFPYGGFVWNRPVSVLVEDARGVRRIPVPDVTRYAQWSLLAISAILPLSMWLLSRKK